MNCRHCGAEREMNDDHYGHCLVIRMALDKDFFPLSEIVRARNAHPSATDVASGAGKRIGKATGVSGDGLGWRRTFRHNGQPLKKIKADEIQTLRSTSKDR